jgi:hypothetical protein
MNALRGLLGFIISIFKTLSDRQMEKSWWVQVKTENPKYTYYFGPFESLKVARDKQPGFVEDLQAEQAEVSHAGVEWCNPPALTIEGAEGVHQPV